MGIKMLGSKVLVTAVEKEQTTSGGIILTADTTKGSKPGLVLAVGPLAIDEVQSGQRVFLDWNKAMPVDYEGEAAAIIDLDWIKAVIS
jgi:co-chaperonin GroES (HSP10)|tara:strand:- start:159 stop:422 length:264 start_codon:yes stop_codon:yes gene_type:complete